MTKVFFFLFDSKWHKNYGKKQHGISFQLASDLEWNGRGKEQNSESGKASDARKRWRQVRQGGRAEVVARTTFPATPRPRVSSSGPSFRPVRRRTGRFQRISSWSQSLRYISGSKPFLFRIGQPSAHQPVVRGQPVSHRCRHAVQPRRGAWPPSHLGHKSHKHQEEQQHHLFRGQHPFDRKIRLKTGSRHRSLVGRRR